MSEKKSSSKNNHPGASRHPSFSRRGNPDELLALAETVANELADRHEELGLGSEAEALLRASIAAATFGINR